MLKLVGAVLQVGAATVYCRGWWHMRRLGHPPARWRLAFYLLGIASLAAALLSPIDDLADDLFPAHMIQHLLLTMTAAPLILLGNPLSIMLWGLPAGPRRVLAAFLRRGTGFRRLLTASTWMPVAWLLYVGNLWVWHLPALYQFAIQHEGVHVLEHALMFSTAILFWWPIVSPAPRLWPRAGIGFSIFYLLAATAQNTALGFLLSVPEHSFYPYYERRAAELGVNALDEQMTAGGIMWASGHMYLLPILLLLNRLARRSTEEA